MANWPRTIVKYHSVLICGFAEMHLTSFILSTRLSEPLWFSLENLAWSLPGWICEISRVILQIQMPRTGNKHAEKSSKALLWKWVSAGPHSVAMPHTDSPGENKNKTFPPTFCITRTYSSDQTSSFIIFNLGQCDGTYNDRSKGKSETLASSLGLLCTHARSQFGHRWGSAPSHWI